MSFTITAIVGIGIAATAATAKLGMALAGRKKRIEEQKAAKEQMQERMGEYENLDTSNLYANVENQYTNMENTYEDLTVNQQQVQFEAQQGMQQRANIMSQMKGTAGSSGIAGLAQAMANQGQLATQRASASIGAQESKINMLQAGEAGRLQQLERAGEATAEGLSLGGASQARGLDWSKTGTLLGMSQQRVGAANLARAQAKAQQMSAIGDIGQTGMSLASLGAGQMGGGGGTTGAGGANMKTSTPTGTGYSGQPLVTQTMTPTGAGVDATVGISSNQYAGLSIIGFNTDGSPIYG